MINLAVSLAIMTGTIPTTQSLDNDFDVALGLAGLTTKTARFDDGILRNFSQPEFATPFYKSAHQNPWRLPFYTEMWERQFQTSVGDPSELVANAGRMIGLGTRRTLLGNPIQSAVDLSIKQGALKAVLEDLKKQGILIGNVPNLSEVPNAVQEAAALVLQVASQTIPYRRATFSDTTDYSKYFRRAMDDAIETSDAELNKADLNFFRKVDMRYLFAAGSDIASAAKHAQVVSQVVEPTTKYRIDINTHWGHVILSGGTSDVYKDDAYLLIIDTGGSDTYLNEPTNKTMTNWMSVLVDTNGDDKYLSSMDLQNTEVAKYADRKKNGSFGPASAAFGVSVLLDSGGSDLYRTTRPGLGSAFMGVSVLEDSSGDDIYDAYTNSEGFGWFGIGILDDWKGSDKYSVFNQGQGFGGVSGFGAILDRLGDDTYSANDTVIDFPSPQTDKHNVSMAQGAASGRRADYIDGHSLSGGIGLLMDEAGKDKYSCGVFGQGCGYWEGTGLLLDEAGDDEYLGQWYVQGAAAHFAIGFLHDSGGSDVFTGVLNMAQGAGHDFSVGMLIKNGGADTYHAPNLSLGASNANGIGIFVDTMGDDTYDSSGISLGRSAEATKGSLRERALGLGVFMDTGGSDKYPAGASWATNGNRQVNWMDKRPSPDESQCGIFWDR